METALSPAIADGGRFVHRPLRLDTSAIRLIEVLPPGPEGEIRCEVQHTTLNEPRSPEYICLSWVWGTPEDARWITMNGRPFQVRKNLWDFLKVISSSLYRSEFKYQRSNIDDEYHLQCVVELETIQQPLWIDALCIDQESTVERNHQVQQMGQIYSSAQRVLAWMGDHPNIVALFRPDWDGYQSKMIQGVESFCDNVYWRRAWITQELVLARNLDLIAGNAIIALQDLRHGLSYHERRKNPRVSALILEVYSSLKSRAKSLIEDIQDHHNQVGLIDNFELYFHKECLNLHDLAYSLLSLSSDGSELQVNYDSSLAELTRDVLILNKNGNCFRSILFILLAFLLEPSFPGVDANKPLIEIDNASMLRKISPCVHCGENRRKRPLETGLSSVRQARYICLHCRHPRMLAPAKLHKHSHTGHLVLFYGLAIEGTDYDWHLFWVSNAGTWHKLEGHRVVMTTAKGRFQSLVLSFGVVYELMELITLEKAWAETDDMDTCSSGWSCLWKMVT